MDTEFHGLGNSNMKYFLRDQKLLYAEWFISFLKSKINFLKGNIALRKIIELYKKKKKRILLPRDDQC